MQRLQPQRRRVWLAGILLLAAAATTVVLHERHLRHQARSQLERHAAILAVHAWNFDEQAARHVLDLIVEAGTFESLAIVGELDEPFVATSPPESPGFGIRIAMEAPLHRGEHRIGTLSAVWRHDSLDVYAYAITLLVLLGLLTRFVFRLQLKQQELRREAELGQALRLATRQAEEAKQEAEQARREAERDRHEAEKANRLKTAFLANMSHEIRTPLSVILGYNSLLESQAAPFLPPENRRQFRAIRDAGQRLIDTIHKIVDISRLSIQHFPFQAEPLRLRRILQECVSTLHLLAESKEVGLWLEGWDSGPDPVVHFDPYALRQALTNVIENAIKYTPAGSVSIRILDASEPDTVLVEVEDTGIGISDDYLQHAFDLFSQERSGRSREFEGTGLGLALTRDFLEAGQGRIELESRKGQGTTARIYLPRSRSPAADETGVADAREERKAGTGDVHPVVPPRSHRPVIAVVEDDPQTQEYMRWALDEHYDVRVAGNDQELESVLAAGPVDLVLMDLSLRGSADGIALTRQLRDNARTRNVPVVALTAHAFDEDRAEALAAGCNDWLAKPCPLNRLISTIEKQLTRSPEASSADQS